MTISIGVLDYINNDPPCPNCSTDLWLVDGDGFGKFWLLCADVMGKNCVECRDLPSDVTVDHEPEDLDDTKDPAGTIDQAGVD